LSRYRFTTFVDAPLGLVFDLWTDMSRLHEWTEGVTKVTDITGPPGQAGSRYTVWFGRFTSRTEVLEADPPNSIRTRFGNRLLRGISSAKLEVEGVGTRLTLEFRVEGTTSRIVARIFATGTYKGSFRGELETFRRIAEREARAGRSEHSRL
jgi:uncharacterized protein YndB with AHSA1/START domain